MAQHLIKCPFCDRRVYRELPTFSHRRNSEIAVEVNMYPHGEMEPMPEHALTTSWT
jgi:hypothetical protein